MHAETSLHGTNLRDPNGRGPCPSRSCRAKPSQQEIDEIIEITPSGGTTETILFQATKPNLQGNLPAERVTCSYDDTKTFPDAVIHVVGFTTGVFTPKS
jgi:hypothetical protein